MSVGAGDDTSRSEHREGATRASARYDDGLTRDQPLIDPADPPEVADPRGNANARGDEAADAAPPIDLSSKDGLARAYAAHGALVHSFCTRSVGAHRAQDVTQEVFLIAWRKAATFDPARGSLPGWLLGIARFRVLAALRDDGRAPLPRDPGLLHDRLPETQRLSDDQPATGGRSGSDAIDALADRMLVAEVLRTLPARVATVIALSYIDGLTHQEIATRTEIPLGTVKSDIRRGLVTLQHALEDLRG